MLVMGVSFGGASYISSQPAVAVAGETEGGEATDDTASGDEGAEADTEDAGEGETPGGEMEDDAQK